MKLVLSNRRLSLLILILCSIVMLGCSSHGSSSTTSGGTTAGGGTSGSNTAGGDTSGSGTSGSGTSGGGTSGGTTPTTPSSDATVSTINLSSGSLDQVVQASLTSYTATEGFFMTSLGVSVTPTDSHASLTINGSSVAAGTSQTISLAEGANTVTVVLTAEDGTTTQTYTINVTRLTLADMAQQAYAQASNGRIGDLLGSSIALSGDTMVVGAPYEDGDANSTLSASNTGATDSGAAYVFTRDSSGVWTQQAYLKASNARSGDDFGVSVAISGDTIVVGADLEDGDASSTVATSNTGATDAGAAYVFTRSNGVWTQQAYLKAGNAQATDYFGISVAIKGDTAVVGAYWEDGDASSAVGSYNDFATNAGAAYVFTRSNGVWTQQSYLKSDNASASDNFGRSVAMSGNTLVVGAYGQGGSGAAYVFTHDSSGVWTQQAQLNASNAHSNDLFGESVAISGDTVVVGADYEDGDATSTVSTPNIAAADAGAAYVFTRDSSGVWTQQAYLKANNALTQDHFGASVAVNGDTVAVGAPYEDGHSSNSGAGYVFTRNAGVWTQQAYLKAGSVLANSNFGASVALYGDTLAGGASGDSSSAGAAFVYR